LEPNVKPTGFKKVVPPRGLALRKEKISYLMKSPLLLKILIARHLYCEVSLSPVQTLLTKVRARLELSRGSRRLWAVKLMRRNLPGFSR
jgi:hypothetical protein